MRAGLRPRSPRARARLPAHPHAGNPAPSAGLPPKLTLSQRDVPCFTREALPHLAAAGVRALSVGVNAGAPPPATPHNALFWWSHPPTGARLLAWVHPGGYSGSPVDGPGECVIANLTAPAGGGVHALCAAWRGDNAGPHSVDEAGSWDGGGVGRVAGGGAARLDRGRPAGRPETARPSPPLPQSPHPRP